MTDKGGHLADTRERRSSGRYEISQYPLALTDIGGPLTNIKDPLGDTGDPRADTDGPLADKADVGNTLSNAGGPLPK